MKNKKLLSVLCLLALVGCQPSSTSGSSNSNQGTSGSSTTTTPSTSSSTQTPSSSSSTDGDSSSSSSSTGGDSSSSSSSTGGDSSGSSSSSNDDPVPPVKPELPGETREEFEAMVLAGIENTLVYADSTQVSANTQFNSYNFYTNAMVQHKQTFGKNHTEENPNITENVKTYKTIKDGRYYEVTDNIKSPTNNSLYGYEVVEENANGAQKNSADAEKAMSFSSHTMDGYFGRGTDIQNTVWSIFGKDTYKDANAYNLTFDAEYIGDTSAMKLYISHTQENPYMGNSIRPNTYSAEYTLDENGDLTNVVFVQKVYNVNDYDTENHVPNTDAEPTSTTTYTYNFQYGELKAEETPAYDVNSMSYTDYSIKFYSDYGKTEEFTGDVFYTNTTYYLGIEGNPETATTDKVYVANSTDAEVFPATSINGYAASSISFRKAGTTTLTFSNASGVTKQVTFNVEAPKPNEIYVPTWSSVEMPTTLSVGGKAELPGCSLDPYGCDTRYEWVFVSGSDYAEFSYDEDSDTHYITGKAAGKAVIKAVAVADPSVCTEEYEISVLAPLSESELKDQILNKNWAYDNYGETYSLSFTETSGEIDFGKEVIGYDEANNWAPIYAENSTTFSFDYTFDYSSGSIEISNGTWNNRSEDSQFNSVTIKNIQMSLLGGSITVNVRRQYNANYGEDLSWGFISTLSSEEVQAKVYGTWYFSMGMGYSEVNIFVDLNEDKTGRIYTGTPSYDEATDSMYINADQSLEFTWDFDENNDVVISGLSGELAFEYQDFDYETNEPISATATLTFGSKLDVEPSLFSSFTISCTKTDSSSEEPFTYTIGLQELVL